MTRLHVSALAVALLAALAGCASPEQSGTSSDSDNPDSDVSGSNLYAKWTSTDAINAFNDAGLEAENATPMTHEDYGAAPMRATEGTRFFIPSLCQDCGGRVLSFSSQPDLDATKAYYDDLARGSAIFFSWTFTKDNLLVQINGELPEEKSRQYDAVLQAMR